MSAVDPVAALCTEVEAHTASGVQPWYPQAEVVLLVARLRQLETRAANDHATIEHQSDTIAAVHACLLVGRVSEAVATIRRACGGDAGRAAPCPCVDPALPGGESLCPACSARTAA